MYVFSELKRRNVFRVGIAYIIVGWLLLQVTDVVLPILELPGWVARLVLFLLVIGFPLALFFAWAFELTPEGLKRESEVDPDQSITKHTGRKLDRAIIAVLLVALAWFAWDRYREPVRTSTAPEIVVSGEQGSATTPAAAGVPEKSIAVLPFTNMSDDASNEYFSDGISEEILNLLARLPGLHVTSRSSAFQFKGDNIHLPTVAQQLGVAHILEGSVRKAGNRVRITAQLIDADEDRHMWSDTWDRELDDIFRIQDEIAAAVVEALQATLLGAVDTTRLEASQTTDPRAYELYLQARHQLWKRRPGPLAEAERLFEQAIEIDPAYAPAHAGLATTMIFLVNNSRVDPARAYARAAAAIDQALALEPENAEAQGALGLLRDIQGRHEEARAALELAIALNPSDARAYSWLSNGLETADPVRALALARQAHAIDPLARIVNLVLAARLTMFGYYDEVMGLARKYQSLYPDSGWAFGFAAGVYYSRGRMDLSVKSMYRAYRTDPDQSSGFVFLPFAMMDLGELDLAEDWLAQLRGLAPDNRWVLFQSARLTDQRGDPRAGAALFADSADRMADPWFDHWQGFHLAHSGDFATARGVIERGDPTLASDPPAFQPEILPEMLNYALVLQRTGSPERAEILLTRSRKLLEAQLAAGVVNANGEALRGWMGQVLALQGQIPAALEALRSAYEQGGLSCVHCLRDYPHFDGLRDEPQFKALLEAVEGRQAAQRQRLADEGMLLTPEELLQLEDFTYDALAE